jgi:hypothetical protein
MDGQEPTGFLNPPTSSATPLPAGFFATGTKYTGMVEPKPAVVIPVVTPDATETGKKSKHCSKLEGCVCGTLLGCMIAADGDVGLFFDLLGKYPIAIFLWFDFSEFS